MKIVRPKKLVQAKLDRFVAEISRSVCATLLGTFFTRA